MSRHFSPKGRPTWRLVGIAALAIRLATPLGRAAADQPLPPPPALPTAPSDPAPSAAPAAPAPPASEPSAGERTDGMRDIERQVGDLKDQVFRAKARLSLLSEKFLRTSPGGGRAVLLHKNQLGRLFQPLRITYQLDGREIYSSGKDGSPLPTAEQPVWDGGLKPGDHTLSVALVYRGNGTPALSYFSQYTYTATAAHRFTASDGGVTRIRVVCREQGNAALTEVADRPLIEFQTEDSGAAPPASPTATATAAPAAAPVKAEDKPLGNR